MNLLRTLSRRRRISSWFVWSWAVVMAFAVEASDKPNVILIYADDMSYGEIRALDPERSKIPTPHLDRLAREGMAFTDAHTTSSVCTPSRYSLLTGRYNWRSTLQGGVLWKSAESLIAKDRKTLGHLFRAQGYHTSIIGKWHLNYQLDHPEGQKPVRRRLKGYQLAPAAIGTTISGGPVTRGFDRFYGFEHQGNMSSLVRDEAIEKEVPVVEVLPELTREAVRQVEEFARQPERPFFLYMALNSPHSPIVPGPEWVGRGGLGTWSDFIAQTDGSVGEVMAALDRSGLSANTIVIFSADNGSTQLARFTELEAKGHFSQGDLRGAKADLWEGGHRVPFILRWPDRVRPGTASDQLICMTDLYATFAEFFAMPIGPATAEDSISFLPALRGETIPAPRTSVVHHSYTGRFAIRKGEWKLLLCPGSGGRGVPSDQEAIAQGLPDRQLYHLGNDRGETRNLIDEEPEVAEALLEHLQTLVDRGRTTPGPRQANDAPVDIFKTAANETPVHKRWRKFPIR